MPIASSDEDGIRIESLAEELKRHRPSLLYLMPNFQNPTGVSLSMERRMQHKEIVKKHDLLVLEDDPYGELVFRGEKLPSLFELGGQEFFPDGSGENTIRLNFSNATPENIEEGIRRMGEVLKESAG